MPTTYDPNPHVRRGPFAPRCDGTPGKSQREVEHRWVLISEDGPGDVYVCAEECGAVDID